MSPSGNSTSAPTVQPSSACVDPSANTTTWIVLGVFLALASFSGILTTLLFRGISGALKKYNVASLDVSFRKLFRRPVAALLGLLFLQLAWNVAPWPCALQVVKDIVGFLILCTSLAVLWVLISRVFEFAEVVIRIVKVETDYFVPLKEGIRVLKLIALFLTGVIFFSIIVLRLDSGNQFTVSFFFASVNFVSLLYTFFFVPLTRDAIGGITYLADRQNLFKLNDWVEIDGTRGVVERIGLFAVAIRSLNGAVTMITNSRFQESVYIIYEAKRRRVVDFRFPLPKTEELLAGESQRKLIAEVEIVLHSLGVNDLFVLYDADPTVGHALEIRFVTSEGDAIEAQVSQMNEAILKVVETVRG